jgi:hypothetical protein
LRIHSLLFVIPSEAGISYITALNSAAYVVLSKENHKQSTEAATLNRKSGGAEGSAVSLSSTAKAEEENCRSLAFTRDDKKERVLTNPSRP